MLEGVAQSQLQVPAPAAGQPAVQRFLRVVEQVGLGDLAQHARGGGEPAARRLDHHPCLNEPVGTAEIAA